MLNQQILTLFTTDNTWWNNPALTENLGKATLETIYMSLASQFFTILIGVPIGLALVATGPGGLYRQHPGTKLLYSIISFMVNIGRSIPFVILMIAIIPLTRLIVGTSLGWQAAVVPLSLAAAAFFARLVESNIQSVEAGKIEAAQMAGASPIQIMFGVQIQEALPMLIQSVTVSLISIIGYGAMAGVLGTGGLGALALNYGYNQFMTDVMVVTVVILLIIVWVVQIIGDMLSRLVDHR